MNPNDILALFGIDEGKLEGEYKLDLDGGKAFLYFQLAMARPSRCPYCGKDNVVINDKKTVVIHHGYVEGMPLSLVITKRRFKCRSCHKTFVEATPRASKRARVSNDTKVLIIQELTTSVTYKSIAAKHGISIPEVLNIFDSLSAPGRLPMPRILSIDEFSFNVSDHIKYPAVITDYWTGAIVDIVKNRQQSYLISYFSKTSLAERNNVKFYVSDMNETYREIKRLFFPKAMHIVDTFHVVKLFTQATQKIRISAMKTLDQKSYEYAFLKGHWKLFLKKRKDIRDHEIYHKKTDEETTTLKMMDKCLNLFPEFRTIYNLKEDFLAYTKGVSQSKATSFLDYFVKRAEVSLNFEIQKLGRTLESWRQEIINSLITNEMGINITNAKAERNNGKIRLLIKISNGLVSFERMRKRILFIDREAHKKGG